MSWFTTSEGQAEPEDSQGRGVPLRQHAIDHRRHDQRQAEAERQQYC